MIKLEDLSKLYKKAKPVSGKPFDIHFEKTVSLIEQEKFSEAVPLIEPILKDGCLDIRLIMYLFYAHFLEKGIKGFSEIFPNIIALLDEHWDKISPIEMREKHTLNSLSWFFSSIKKKLQHSEKIFKEKGSNPFWERIVKNLPVQETEKLSTITRQLIDFFNNKWENTPINQNALFILKWLKDFTPSVIEEKQSPEEALLLEQEQIEAISSKQEQAVTPRQLSRLEEILLSSAEIKLLYEKIQIFEELINNNDFAKASLVADDIKTVAETYNLDHFFPKLFSSFFALLAKHIDTITEYWQANDTPQWHFLGKLYQADLESFIKW